MAAIVRTTSEQHKMMNHLSSCKGMKISMRKTVDEPDVIIGTCWGRYPAAVTSPTRPVGVYEAPVNDDQYFVIEHNGAKLETYNRYCVGAKEIKVTTIKYFCDNGVWMKAADYWAKYGL